MKKILVATDGSEKSKHAMEQAASLAKAFDAEITVISVSQDTQFYIGDQTFGSGHMFVLQEDIEKAVKQILKRCQRVFRRKRTGSQNCPRKRVSGGCDLRNC
jgi:nucleotide-binding universal stress UspA family protein